MERLEVHLSRSYKFTLWLVGIFTLGVGALGMWLSARSWPRVLDPEGITLRSGARVAWNQLTDVRRVTVVDELGRKVTGRLELVFGETKVKIVPQSLAEGQAVLDYLGQLLGEEVAPG